MNTPLTTLITSCERELRNVGQNEGLQDILGSNLEELQRMSEILKSMMFLSHAETGSRARCVEVASVAELVSHVVDYHEAMLGEAKLDVDISGDEVGKLDVPLVKRAVSKFLKQRVMGTCHGTSSGMS